jgi:hypothetical protein
MFGFAEVDKFTYAKQGAQSVRAAQHDYIELHKNHGY